MEVSIMWGAQCRPPKTQFYGPQKGTPTYGKPSCGGNPGLGIAQRRKLTLGFADRSLRLLVGLLQLSLSKKDGLYGVYN